MEDSYYKRLKLTLAISLMVIVIQIFGSIITGSLVLLVDTVHAVVDSLGLIVAVIAARLMTKAAHSSYSWGYQRVEVLGAGLQCLLLLLTGVYGIYEGISRLIEGHGETSGYLIIFAGIGLVSNLVMLSLLLSSREDNLNARAAFLDVLGDSLGSFAVLIGALIAIIFGINSADSWVAIAFSAFIIYRSIVVIKPVLSILLEKAPDDTSIEAVSDYLLSYPEIIGIDDIHISRVSSNLPVVSAHVIVDDELFFDGSNIGLLRRLQTAFAEEGESPGSFNHSTFQIEPLSNLDNEKLFHGRYTKHPYPEATTRQ